MAQKNIHYYQKDEKIIRAGEQEKMMFIILEGEVEVSLIDNDVHIVIGNLGKNDFFGEISLFSKKPRSATIKAISNVKAFCIESEMQLTMFLLRNPKFASKMVKILAQRLARTDEILIGKISELNRIKLRLEQADDTLKLNKGIIKDIINEK
ncbi:MAG: cyclic nucleotide-binding domain-containing protein [Leptospiraceae bacterium]|nr:cyclic nucleotide-binding domain-containing protein [Leptospiraceae bacterium]MCP5513063.1 cyclic nucleotide-binding domain-containing protein [Leptospiraceae bacterium]